MSRVYHFENREAAAEAAKLRAANLSPERRSDIASLGGANSGYQKWFPLNTGDPDLYLSQIDAALELQAEICVGRRAWTD
jgi:hypothetical protein